MYKNASENNKEHNRLIFAMVKHLISKGYKVSADHISYPNGKPDEYGGKRPDIHATKEGEEIFIEAETCESLKSKETKEQWKILSTRDNTMFSVIIPKKCLSEAKKLAREWKVPVETYWTMDI